MCIEIKNKDYQYFGYGTYRCLPLTLGNYRLYILSGFYLIVKELEYYSIFLYFYTK